MWNNRCKNIWSLFKCCNYIILFSAADAVRNDKISEMLEKRQAQDVRALNQALNDFRSLHQQPDGRREFDLYDPDYLKKDKPGRVSDDDPRCGISSIQKFEGKDCFFTFNIFTVKV